MKAFRVWVRPLDYEYLVCVDGVENARWLLDQLAASFIFRSAQPISQENDSTLCTFQVPSSSQLPLSRMQKVLTAIPEVTLLRAAVAAK
ncbi:MAG TPA: hypothetical protein VGI40_17485 [Pirellulaceae bacterium]